MLAMNPPEHDSATSFGWEILRNLFLIFTQQFYYRLEGGKE